MEKKNKKIIYQVNTWRKHKRNQHNIRGYNNMKGSIHQQDKLNLMELHIVNKFSKSMDEMLETLGTQKTIFHLEMVKQKILEEVIKTIENEE